MSGSKPRAVRARKPKNLPDDYQLASEVDEKLIRWLIDQRLAAGVITLIAGRPGQGKSLFTSWLAAYMTQGGDRVMFSNLEDMKGETTGRGFVWRAPT